MSVHHGDAPDWLLRCRQNSDILIRTEISMAHYTSA